MGKKLDKAIVKYCIADKINAIIIEDAIEKKAIVTKVKVDKSGDISIKLTQEYIDSVSNKNGTPVAMAIEIERTVAGIFMTALVDISIISIPQIQEFSRSIECDFDEYRNCVDISIMKV